MVNRGDSFHDCWANIGTLIHMKDSIQSAIAARAFDCGYIQAAHQRVEEMRSSPADALEPPTVLELEQALGGKVEKCELWTTNWRNRVYRVELASGGAALAKQVVRGTNANVQYQYEQLGVLARVQILGVRVPKALGLLRAKRGGAMGFV